MARPAIYRPRRPEARALYQCLEQHWEEFQQAYTPLYEKDHGPLPPVVEKTVGRFLECGILRHGFARIRRGSCHEEYLLAFSCKTRYFCPSCQAKRVAAFVERMTEEILEAVDHRQLVWTIPRVLRPTFRRDRRLPGELACCAWSTLKAYTQARFPDPGVAPGAILAIQTCGDQLNFHPHPHWLLSDGAWDRQGQFHPFGPLDYDLLTRLFQHLVLEMLTGQRRRNWARLLKKIYEVDPLACPRRGSRMEIMAFIEDWAVIRKILQHLNLWERPRRAPPPPLLPHKLEAFPAALSPRRRQQVRASTDSVFWDDVPVYHG